MKRHIIGSLIALGLAVIALFAINTLMSNQLLVNEEVVINKSSDEVLTFIEDPRNLTVWIKELHDKELSYHVEEKKYQYFADDDIIRWLKFNFSKSSKGMEIIYFEEKEKKAIFTIKVIPQDDQTILKYNQNWNLGWNPIAKLMGKKIKKDIEVDMKKDLLALKRYLEIYN